MWCVRAPTTSLAHSETYTSKASAKNCADIIAGGGKVEDLT
jgi:hypothetical protein